MLPLESPMKRHVAQALALEIAESALSEMARGVCCYVCSMNGSPGVEPIARVLRDAGFGPPLCRAHWERELELGRGSEPFVQAPHVLWARELLRMMRAVKGE
jgi:hypothetical protein